MTQLLELVEKRRFVGRELLLFLWMESELFEATLATREHGSFGLWIEKKLVLSHEEESTRITAPMPGAGREAKEALRRGQLPESATIRISWKDDETALTIDAESFALRGLALRTRLDEPQGGGLAGDLVDEMAGAKRGKPKRKKVSEEDELRLERETAFRERMEMTREVEDLLGALYRDFLALRLGPAWSKVVVPTFVRWAAGERIDADAYRRAKLGKAPKKR